MIAAKISDYGGEKSTWRSDAREDSALPVKKSFLKQIFSVHRAAQHAIGLREK
jgi:hypothetical protein